ncbi:MAG: DUF2807 domain-containing protein [Saprospiraceae bacterium]|nr:DUF2807 domain-containing protein [Saprospiraceae bacterium]
MRYRYFILTVVGLALAGLPLSGQMLTHLPSFDKIKVGPRVALVLEKGDQASVRLAYEGLDEDLVNVEVKQGTLLIYLDRARNLEPKRKIVTPYGKVRESIYSGTRVTAYVTYQDLNKLVMKGDEDARISGDVSGETFKLKAYGDSEISFASLHTGRLKVKMFGDCALTMGAGTADRQKYVVFGDHHIDARYLTGSKVKATSLGDTHLRVNGDQVKVTALGEADISCPDSARLRKFVIGESSVQRFRTH